MQEAGTADGRVDTRLGRAAWASGVRTVPSGGAQVRFSRQRNEEEESPDELCALVITAPVTTFQNLQTVDVGEIERLTVE